MGLLKKYTPWEQEYRRVWQQEEKYLNQYAEKKSGALRVKLEGWRRKSWWKRSMGPL